MKLVNVRNNAWNGVWNGAWSVWYGARANAWTGLRASVRNSVWTQTRELFK